jgi:hypothetical protein
MGLGGEVIAAGERFIKVQMAAVPERPETLVEYIKELMRRGATGLSSSYRRSVKVVFGIVQVKGRRGNTPVHLLTGFMGAMKPLNITLWWWDSALIGALPNTISTIRLPNMRADGHIQPRDMTLLSNAGSHLKRLELFRVIFWFLFSYIR